MKQKNLKLLRDYYFELVPSACLSQVNYRALTEHGYVYIVAIENPMSQGYGRSRIVYVGKTKNNPAEAFSSGLMNVLLATDKFKHKKGLGRWNHRWIYFLPLARDWGITADELESALIFAFITVYRTKPLLNDKKKHVTESVLEPLRTAWKDSAGLMDSLQELIKQFEKPSSESDAVSQAATPGRTGEPTLDVPKAGAP